MLENTDLNCDVMEQIVYDYLIENGIDKLITGTIEKKERLANSKLEDVIVNTINVDSGDTQYGAGNINIHVPNINVNIGGSLQNLPDHKRIAELKAIILPLFKKVSRANYNFFKTGDQTIKDPQTGEYFGNIQYQFYWINPQS